MKHLLSRDIALPEMDILLGLIENRNFDFKLEVLDEIDHKNHRYPIYGLVAGNPDPTAPVFCMTAGVHGLERIGTHVALSFLKSWLSLGSWSKSRKSLLRKMRFVVIPIVNPVGMALKSRYNANRVDLMRNAPLDSPNLKKHQLWGGQSYSPRLPWFRGNNGLEKESQALINFVKKHTFESKCTISLDLHSGFGLRDRIWFPFAHTTSAPPCLVEIYKLRRLLREGFPYHAYKFEPQIRHYLIHGDLWDYLLLEHEKSSNSGIFLPLTLELGSWLWLKKNPRQLFSMTGYFNPMSAHRYERVLRRHIMLIGFLMEACISSKKWIPQNDTERHTILELARSKWYN